MEVGQVIAINVNRLRNQKNLSMGQLAELAGVSKVMLSQLEKGTSNPTINTIWKLAGALDVPYTSLLELPETDCIHVKKSDIVGLPDHKYTIFPYYKKDEIRNFEIYQIEMEPGCEHASIGHSSESAEYIMMIEGEMELEVNGEMFILKKDDGFCFEAIAPHTYRNNKNKNVKAVLLINYKA